MERRCILRVTMRIRVTTIGEHINGTGWDSDKESGAHTHMNIHWRDVSDPRGIQIHDRVSRWQPPMTKGWGCLLWWVVYGGAFGGSCWAHDGEMCNHLLGSPLVRDNKEGTCWDFRTGPFRGMLIGISTLLAHLYALERERQSYLDKP